MVVPPGIRAVVFDFYGTLVRMVEPLPPDHRGVFARRGLAAQGELWGDQWSVGPGEGEEHTAHSADETAYVTWERERLRRRARACGVPEEALDGLVEELDRAMKAVRLALFADVRESLAALRRCGLLVGVCSNWYWDLEDRVAEVGLGETVDLVVGSARTGARKPHPLIYRAVLEGCALPAERVLFVGDMWVPDVLGPLAAGMRAVHLWRPDRAVDGIAPPLPEGAVRIAGLRELTAGGGAGGRGGSG
ncbi:HAD family hydrolase [Streptomyces sp. NPDC015661]|uniref:HAD family hydrolase n=1 Tax=Streptomyces sp. NPDC015661 TaxID=3364961 RepID=UPI0036F4E64E